jgi:hypothetical protein
VKRRLWWLLPLLALSIAGAWLWVATASWRIAEPALIKNLPDAGGSRHNAQFSLRLARRFPVGSSEQLLATELRREGFSLIDRDRPTSTQRDAKWHRDGFPCVSDAEVSWTADRNGRIATIDGMYGYVCL